MMDKIKQLFELSNKIKAAILVGSFVLVIGGFWGLLLGPVYQETSEVDTEVTGLRKDIDEKAAIAANLDKFERRVKELDIELNKALQELPDKREVDMLLHRISDKARDSGLEVQLFQPQGEQKADFYASVPVKLVILGSYHEIATFFDEVGRMERIINLNSISLTEPRQLEAGTQLKTSVMATGFRFLEEEEILDAAEAEESVEAEAEAE